MQLTTKQIQKKIETGKIKAARTKETTRKMVLSAVINSWLRRRHRRRRRFRCCCYLVAFAVAAWQLGRPTESPQRERCNTVIVRTVGQLTNVDFDGAVAVVVIVGQSEGAAAAESAAATAAAAAFNKLRQIKLWQTVGVSGQLRGMCVGSWQAAEILIVVVVYCLVNHKINGRICGIFWLDSFCFWMCLIVVATYPSTSTKMPSSPTAVTWPCCFVVVIVALTLTSTSAQMGSTGEKEIYVFR